MCQKEMDRKSIDALKGIGILGVLLVHYGLKTSNDLLKGIVFSGARGVQLMFIINAFLIFNSLSKIKLSTKNIIEWWKQKFLRLIPLYWFFTIVYLFIFGTGHNYYLGTLSKVSWLNILANILFLHGFYPYYINSININWFMADLAIFYVLAPFMYKIINSLERSIASILLIVPIGYFLNKILSNVYVLEVKSIWLDYINIFSFLSELPIILLGIVCFYLYKSVCENGIKNRKLLGISILFFSIISMLSLVLKKNNFVVFSDIFSFGILFALIFLGQLLHPIFLIKNKIFEFIGKHSYGIYLSHLVVLKYINLFLGELRNYNLIDVIGYLLLVVISCMVSMLSEYVIEKNAIKLLKGYRK